MPIRIRAILPKQGSVEFEGTPADLYDRARKLNLDGRNIYIVGQNTGAPSAGDTVRDSDITGVRLLFADQDDAQPLPTAYHVEPTFRLLHPDTGRWWLFWTVIGVGLAEREDYLLRVAAHYGTDASVATVLVVRLAGFDRWKEGKNYGPYDLQVMSGKATDAFCHVGLPALPPRAQHPVERLEDDDVISAERLRNLLAFIDPVDRDDWRNVIFAARDAKVLLPNLERMEPYEVLTLLDSWASGELWAAHTGPKLSRCDVGAYQGPDDTERLFYGKRGGDGKVRIGSVVHFAKEHARKQGLDVPSEACRPGAGELFKPVVTLGADAVPAGMQKKSKLHLGSAMRQVVREKPREIISSVIGVGTVTIVSGDKGTGKSALMSNAAYSVLTGTPWMGHVTRPGTVFILAGEGFDRTVHDFEANCLHGGREPDEVMNRGFAVHEGSIPLNSPAGIAKLLELLEEFKAAFDGYPDVLLIDTARKNFGRGSVNDDKDVGSFFEHLEKVQALGISVVVVAHVAKGGGGTGTKGSSDWEQGADYVLHFKGKVRDRKTEVFFEKVKSGPDGHSFQVNYVYPEVPGLGETLVPVFRQASSGADTAGPAATGSGDAPRERDPTVTSVYLNAAKRILDQHLGASLAASALAAAVMAEAAPDVNPEEHRGAYVRMRDDCCQKVKRAFKRDRALHAYVCGWTTGGDPSKFCNPAQNTRRTPRPTHAAPAARQ